MFAPLAAILNRLVTSGNLTITDSQNNHYHYGDGNGDPVHIRLNSPIWEKRIALNPALKFGEAYMEGGIDFLEGDVLRFMKILFANHHGGIEKTSWLIMLQAARNLTRRLAQSNTLTRSRHNIHHHYDLSAELYALFLDTDRQYSCGYFEYPGQSLEEAQLAKKRHLAAKLLLKPGQSLLDIGCGWGGLGLYMARFLEADVTGVTLSYEQHIIAERRAEKSHLSKHCRFYLQDYRHLEQNFDRIVSVGMFEHVGIGHYQEYFSHIRKLLKSDGVFVLHSIGRSDGPGSTNPFIRKYIFPGGYIPALSEVLPAIEKSGLIVTDIEILRLHYAETLKIWRENFMKKRERIKQLYDERFCRMWDFYLASSESAFRWQDMAVFQIQITRNQEAVPLTRDYIYKEEQRLRQIDGETLSETAPI